MKKVSLWVYLAVVVLTAPAVAEPLGVGVARNGGPFYNMVIAIGKALQTHGEIEFRPRTHRGSAQYLPLVDNGELELGIANALELGLAYNGTGVYDGRAYPNLRLIGATYPFRLALYTSVENDARSAADIRGMKLPGTFSSSPIANVLIDSILANAGVDRDEVVFVPVSSWGQMFDDFTVGKLDLYVSILGSEGVAQAEQKIGKLRALSAVDGEAALAAARRHIPMASVERYEPAPGLIGVDEPIFAIAYDVLLFANKDLPDDVVYEIAKAMTVYRPEMIEINPSFALLDADELAPQFGLPYHPGAERFYRENGTWPNP